MTTHPPHPSAAKKTKRWGDYESSGDENDEEEEQQQQQQHQLHQHVSNPTKSTSTTNRWGDYQDESDDDEGGHEGEPKGTESYTNVDATDIDADAARFTDNTPTSSSDAGANTNRPNSIDAGSRESCSTRKATLPMLFEDKLVEDSARQTSIVRAALTSAPENRDEYMIRLLATKSDAVPYLRRFPFSVLVEIWRCVTLINMHTMRVCNHGPCVCVCMCVHCYA